MSGLTERRKVGISTCLPPASGSRAAQACAPGSAVPARGPLALPAAGLLRQRPVCLEQTALSPFVLRRAQGSCQDQRFKQGV